MLLAFEELSQRVHAEAGIVVRLEDRGTMPSVHSLPKTLIDQAVQLNDPYLVIEFLGHYIATPEWHRIKPFVFGTILKGIHYSEGVGGLWTMCLPLEKLLVQSPTTLFSPFETSILSIIRPELGLWNEGGGFAGGMVFAIMRGAYEMTLEKGFLPLLGKRTLIAVEPADVKLWFRRWIAQSIAFQFHHRKMFQFPIHAKLLEFIAPQSQWTLDTHKAIAGLNRELQEGLINLDTTVPGYAGPDEWYQ